MTKFCIDCKTMKERAAFFRWGRVCRECQARARRVAHVQWTEEDWEAQREKQRQDAPRRNAARRLRHACMSDDEREKDRQYQRRLYEADPDRVIARGLAWRARNYDRFLLANRAGLKVRRAIAAGLIQRPDTCETCGRQRVIEAAHEDYARPLEVRWLCRPCHRVWDAKHPKSLRGPAEAA